MFFVAVLGGALGARVAKAEAWKGSCTAMLAVLISILVVPATGGGGALAYALIGVLALGTVGAALKLTGPQIASVALGMFLATSVLGLLSDSLEYLSHRSSKP
jgi:acetyl-CoA carboxylase beta subunit